MKVWIIINQIFLIDFSDYLLMFERGFPIRVTTRDYPYNYNLGL